MATPREFAYVYLGTNSSAITEPPAEFCDGLLRIDEELLAIEEELAKLSLGIELLAQRSIGELEQRCITGNRNRRSTAGSRYR